MIKEELGEEIQVWIQVIQMVGNPIFAKVERITTKKKGLKGPASKRQSWWDCDAFPSNIALGS